MLQRPQRLQPGGLALQGVLERGPSGQERLVSHRDGAPLPQAGRAGQQPVVDEHLQHRRPQRISDRVRDAAAGIPAGLIHRGQIHQPTQDLLPAQRALCPRAVQRLISLTRQRALHTPELVVVNVTEPLPPDMAVSQLMQRECQQRQRLAAASVGQQPGYQAVRHPQPGGAGRLLDRHPQHVPTQRRHREHPHGAGREGSVEIVAELPPHRRQDMNRLLTDQGRQHRQERSPGLRGGPGEQLLGLVQGKQDLPGRRTGRPQLLHQPVRPTVNAQFHPDRGQRPRQPGLGGGAGQGTR